MIDVTSNAKIGAVPPMEQAVQIVLPFIKTSFAVKDNNTIRYHYTLVVPLRATFPGEKPVIFTELKSKVPLFNIDAIAKEYVVDGKAWWVL